MKLSIIIPCYNESKDIAKNVETVKSFLNDKKIDYELILVNDGSKDDTQKVIESIPGVLAVGYEINRGKGGAVKYGIEHATGDYILFMDADLSTDITAIEQVVALAPENDFIIGSRHSKDSLLKKKQPLLRRFIGWCCRKIVNLKIGTRYKDTQCGFKAIKTELAQKIVSKQLINDFAFDVEYIYIAKLNQINIKEIGVTWADDRGSTVSPFKSSMRFLKDLRKIKKNRKQYYFSRENEDKDQDTSKLPIIVMIVLFFLLIGLFAAFLIVKSEKTNAKARDDRISDNLNSRLLGLVNEQIIFNSFDEDAVNNVNAVLIEDDYPFSYRLKVAASSNIKVYYYETYGHYPSDDAVTNLTSYLMHNNDKIIGSSSLAVNTATNIEINNEKNPRYIISKNEIDELFVSGCYFADNQYFIYLKRPYIENSDPFKETADMVVNQEHQLFKYFSYLARW